MRSLVSLPGRICPWSGVLLLLLMAGFSLPAQAGSNKIGNFTVVAGKVDALREQQDAPIAAEIGMDAFLNDVVRTKHRSRTQLRFIDNSVLNMGPDYMIKIKDYVYDEENGVRKAILTALRGTVRATIAKLAPDAESVFEIETPTAVASVRGTDFIVTVNSQMQTEVVVLEGRVDVRNVNPAIRGVVKVTAGRKTTVDKSAPPSQPVIVPKKVQAMLVDKTTPQVPQEKSAGGPSSPGGAGGGATGQPADVPPPAAEAAPAPPPPENLTPPPPPQQALIPVVDNTGGGSKPSSSAAPVVQPDVINAAPTAPVQLQLQF